MSLRAVVVDDEPLAREGIALLLAAHDVDVVAACANAQEAIHAVTEASPDVVFLDIHMPRMSGFDVIETIGIEAMPPVVFVTAYDEHAVRAFRANAADYLLKPVDDSLLAESLDRLRRRLARETENDRARHLRQMLDSLMSHAVTAGAVPAGARPPERIAIRERSRVTFVDPDKITRVAAAGDYVTVHTGGREILVRDTIGAMQQRLGAAGFTRIHRSHIVNTRCVRTLEISPSGGSHVVLDDGTTLPVGRSWKDALIAALNIAETDA